MYQVCPNYDSQLLSLNTKLAVVKSLLWHLLLTIHFEHTRIFIYLNLANILHNFFSFILYVICRSDMACFVQHTHKIVKWDCFFDKSFLHFSNKILKLTFGLYALTMHWNKSKISRCTQHAHKQDFASIITCISVSLFENNYISLFAIPSFLTGIF